MQFLQCNRLLIVIGLSGFLAACQITPVKTSKPVTTAKTGQKKPATSTNSTTDRGGLRGIPLPGAGQGAIQSSPLPSNNPNQVVPGYKPVQPNVALRDGSNIPVFRVLINRAQQQLQANQLDEAEQTLIQAQRMAPQSTAVYAYLSEIAIKKRQGNNAEAMARKGLLLANSPKQQAAFWQLILMAAQIQNNAILAAQAREKIQQLSAQ